MTEGAKEPESAVMGFVVDFERIGDQGDDLDAIAQLAQIVF
jgi:hypothetical protein